MTRQHTEVFPVRIPHIVKLDGLPVIHTNPFDRMLVAQALAEDCTLVSRDTVLARYGAPVVW